MSAEVLPILADGLLRRDGRADLLALGGGLLAGEGLYETLALRAGRPLFLVPHLERLSAGAAALGLGPAPDPALWKSDLAQWVSETGVRDAALRLLFVRDGATCRRIVAGSPLPPDAGLPARLALAEAELRGPRPLARWKTLNGFASRLALARAEARGFDEAVLHLEDGTVLEGTRSSVFLVDRGELWTPPLALPILPGVTRAVLLDIASELGLRVREEPFSFGALRSAEEVFLTASVRGLRPVVQVEDVPLGPAPGPWTRRLLLAYAARAQAEVEGRPGDAE
jgi:branched-subunit amino acid aminotransferase/4-amino-4-deoxychorismate lyase